jgi:hypothetical protein
MLEIKEDLLQFIWQHKLIKPLPLITGSGKKIELLNSGTLNRDSGPDFFNAQIRLEGLLLAGNIEVHTRSSDWLRHGHQKDNAYNNLILHVVYLHDTAHAQNEENNVEVLELKDYIDETTLKSYSALCNSKEEIPCNNLLDKLEDIYFSSWLTRMTLERLELKLEQTEHLFKSTGGNFTQTFFILLLRNFGFKVNAVPFELLAKQLPVQILLRHSNDLFQTEALLLGGAGLLEHASEDSYVQKLQNEYEFLSRKYKLVRLEGNLFKYSRIRPANFPDLRLAQFASFVHQHPEFLQSPQNFIKAESIAGKFLISAGTYWEKHFRLGVISDRVSPALGKDSSELLVINTLVPFYFFYAKKQFKPEYKELAINLLEICRFEKNNKTRLFSKKSKVLNHAADSQACIQLYDRYCSAKRCLNCGIAAALLKTA